MIERFSFGSIVINGIRFTGDLKIVRGRVVPNWWRKSGHQVAIEDVTDILESKPEIIVLGKGEPGLMKSSRALRDYVNEQNIELIEEKTSKAVMTFNRLFGERRNVAAGFHLSC